MPSTFFGLTIAGSALNSFHVATNTVANNVSNVNTKGYCRQEAVHVAADPMRTNHRYGMVGTGVSTPEIIQKRDFYYDVKYWDINAKVGRYDAEFYYMEQIEDYLIDEEGAKGFATILDEMFASLETLRGTPESPDSRKTFIGKCQNFTSFFTSMNAGLTQIQNDLNEEIAAQVEDINGIAQKIALLNKQINIIELQGTNANELRDQRALLIDQLSERVSVEVEETKVPNSVHPDIYTGATNYQVKINGHTLVDNFEYNTLKYVPRDKKINQSDSEGLYDLYWSDTDMPFSAAGSNFQGRLKALFAIRDGNNGEAFQGKVLSLEPGGRGDVVTISNPNITDVNSMTMPAEGVITIHNTEYYYTGFSYDAETQTYKFQLNKPLSTELRETLPGKTAMIGDDIDTMGIPYYQAQMNMFVREFARQFNDLHQSGVDTYVNAGTSYFVAKSQADGTEYGFGDYQANGSMDVYQDNYYQLTAANFSIAGAIVKDPNKMVTMEKTDLEDGVATQEIVTKMLTLKSEVTMFRGGGADSFLKCLIDDNSVDTEKAKLFLKNYQNIRETVETKRMSISGVDEDEEALDMMKFQNAYNLASKIIQTLTEMYDRLILETGV